MNQLIKVEQKKQNEEQQVKRQCKGRALALTRNVYRLLNTDVFYVESESSNNIYYYVKFKPDVIEFCSCLDSSTRNVRCKHSFAVEYAIRLGTLKDTERLPKEAKKAHMVAAEATIAAIAEAEAKESYRNDDYSF